MFKGESFASTQASGISEGLAAAFPFVLFFRYGFAPVGRTAQGRTITAELADPSSGACAQARFSREGPRGRRGRRRTGSRKRRSEEHRSELQSRGHLVCRLLLEKKKKKKRNRGTSVGS